MILALLLPTLALAAPTLHCGTPAALAGIGERPIAPPPAQGLTNGERDKSWYREPSPFHMDSANFTVGWEDEADADTPTGAAAIVALEQAWTALVEEQGWPLPVSADQHLLHVILDPQLSSTGLTTEHATAEYPQGYPVIHLDPQWAEYPDFFAMVAHHEFMHAIQFAMRDVWTVEAWEAWYWEASAQWAARLVDPSNPRYADSSGSYADQPELRFDSLDEQHAYGMVVFNAWLEADRGAGAMRAVWEEGAAAGPVPWDGILESATGSSVSDLWAPFAGATGNERLPESELFAPVRVGGWIAEGTSGRVAYLGTDYLRAPAVGWVGVGATGPGEAVVLGSWGDHGGLVAVGEGETVGVVGLTDGGADYVLHWIDAPAGIGNPPDPPREPGGFPDDSDDDSGNPKDSPEEPGGFPDGVGCAFSRDRAPVGWLLLLVPGARRRRREPATPRA